MHESINVTNMQEKKKMPCRCIDNGMSPIQRMEKLLKIDADIEKVM